VNTFTVPGLSSTDGPKPLEITVTVHGKQSVLHMTEPREYLAMTGPEPIQIGARLFVAAVEADKQMAQPAISAAMAIIDAVYELCGDMKPAGGAVKHELIERHRGTLTKRLEVVMNSTREKRTVSNQQMAKQLVDIMLSEVFS
jgi:hypothetical protein